MTAISELTMEEVRRRAAPLLASEPAVAAAYIFGSYARGQARPDSDLDVGVLYRKGGARHHDAIAARLAGAIASAVGVERVDVVDIEAQGAVFAHNALCEGERIYEADRDRRVDFESDAMVHAFDFRPTYELATRGKAAALRHWLRKRYDLREASEQARHPEGKSREAG